MQLHFLHIFPDLLHYEHSKDKIISAEYHNRWQYDPALGVHFTITMGKCEMIEKNGSFCQRVRNNEMLILSFIANFVLDIKC